MYGFLIETQLFSIRESQHGCTTCVSWETIRDVVIESIAHAIRRKRGWRKCEPAEPPVEQPSLISTAFSRISGHSLSVSSISENLSLPESETINLIYGDHLQPSLFHAS